MKPGFIPAPEEMKMLAIMRNLQQMGYSKEDPDTITLVPEKPDEREDIKVEETAFPGEFTPLRIPR
jgi:hypothetical protein